MYYVKLTLCTVILFFSVTLHAEDIEVCSLNPQLFYYSTASEGERLAMLEFAVTSNEKFNKRTVPLDTIREVLYITPEQIESGYVVKLMQKKCSHPLGFYSLKSKPAEFATGIIELQLLYIHPDYVRKGLGTRLLSHAAEHAKKLGMKTMSLYSMPESKEFYEKYGAIQTGTYINLFNPEGDERVVIFDFKIDALQKRLAKVENP